jgi:hypothetical protein
VGGIAYEGALLEKRVLEALKDAFDGVGEWG